MKKARQQVPPDSRTKVLQGDTSVNVGGPKGVNRIAGDRLTLAVQRSGRLTESSLALLRDAGLRFEHHGERLFAHCQNFPLTLLFSRDDDIPLYVAGGTVDLGIVGRNLLYEEAVEGRVTEVLPLGFGHCSLVVAVPMDSHVTQIDELAGATIASAYPHSARRFFAEQGVSVETVALSGSVEVAPTLG
ncbi:MAG TPA: ATP phosphoribosyltransferase, partial [Chloroflexota bacterium]|nr:ATP phosphoribosyltransferase [Chloroflexota bacterium]